MAINPLRVAKHLCKVSDWELSNLELQKLIYIAHMLYLGKTGNPLVNGEFQAWDYGPVHPELYEHLKSFGPFPVKDFIFDIPLSAIRLRDLDNTKDKDKIEIMRSCLEEFPPGSTSKLIDVTHQKNGAWAKKYRKYVKNIPITNEDIKTEYNRRLQEKVESNG